MYFLMTLLLAIRVIVEVEMLSHQRGRAKFNDRQPQMVAHATNMMQKMENEIRLQGFRT